MANSFSRISSQSRSAGFSTREHSCEPLCEPNNFQPVFIREIPGSFQQNNGIGALASLQNGTHRSTLLIAHGLEKKVLEGEDFHAKLRNEPYLDLVIERHILPDGKTQGIYLTHYIKEGGDQVIDSEMIFAVLPEGRLRLVETAGRGSMGKWRSLDNASATGLCCRLGRESVEG